MEYTIFVIVMLFFVLIIFVKGMIDEQKKSKLFKKKLEENYGFLPEGEIDAEQLKHISKYFEKHQVQESIDSITWNDLELDRLFVGMNYTYSSAGAEYLYSTLRNPKMNRTDLEKMETLVHYFSENQSQRIEFQLLMAKLGNTGKYSLYEYLDFLEVLKGRNNIKQYVMIILILFFGGCCFVNASVGIFGLVMTICYNVSSYLKDKADINPYLISFSYINRLFSTIGSIQKLKIPEIEEQQKILTSHKAQFNKFQKGFQLIRGGQSSSNPLAIIMDYINMVFHVDIIQFNNMLSFVMREADKIDECITVVGYLESTIAIGAFRASRDQWCNPSFTGTLTMVEGGHPLIDSPVTNNIHVNRGVLLTGSNASGKSTFLKTVAINALLAQTINTCIAKEMTSDFFHIYTSMSLRDSLENKESYYMMEIKSLKRILDVNALKEGRILCFVDEVLRGTNTVERIAASTQILKYFAIEKVICFAASHDIELTHLLEHEYDNYHFTEDVVEGDITFSYKLRNGRATTRNAILLLGMMGYQQSIIDEATSMAEEFVNTGQWPH